MVYTPMRLQSGGRTTEIAVTAIVPKKAGFGLFIGTIVYKIDYVDDTVSEILGQVPSGRTPAYTIPSSDTGYFFGGDSTTQIDGIGFYTDVYVNPAAALTYAPIAGFRSIPNNCGYLYLNATGVNTMRFDFATETMSHFAAGARTYRSACASLHSQRSGYTVGGDNTTLIDSLDFADEVCSPRTAALTVARYIPYAVQSPEMGYVIGGVPNPVYPYQPLKVNVDGFEFATEAVVPVGITEQYKQRTDYGVSSSAGSTTSNTAGYLGTGELGTYTDLTKFEFATFAETVLYYSGSQFSASNPSVSHTPFEAFDATLMLAGSGATCVGWRGIIGTDGECEMYGEGLMNVSAYNPQIPDPITLAGVGGITLSVKMPLSSARGYFFGSGWNCKRLSFVTLTGNDFGTEFGEPATVGFQLGGLHKGYSWTPSSYLGTTASAFTYSTESHAPWSTSGGGNTSDGYASVTRGILCDAGIVFGGTMPYYGTDGICHGGVTTVDFLSDTCGSLTTALTACYDFGIPGYSTQTRLYMGFTNDILDSSGTDFYCRAPSREFMDVVEWPSKARRTISETLVSTLGWPVQEGVSASFAPFGITITGTTTRTMIAFMFATETIHSHGEALTGRPAAYGTAQDTGRVYMDEGQNVAVLDAATGTISTTASVYASGTYVGGGGFSALRDAGWEGNTRTNMFSKSLMTVKAITPYSHGRGYINWTGRATAVVDFTTYTTNNIYSNMRGWEGAFFLYRQIVGIADTRNAIWEIPWTVSWRPFEVLLASRDIDHSKLNFETETAYSAGVAMSEGRNGGTPLSAEFVGYIIGGTKQYWGGSITTERRFRKWTFATDTITNNGYNTYQERDFAIGIGSIAHGAGYVIHGGLVSDGGTLSDRSDKIIYATDTIDSPYFVNIIAVDYGTSASTDTHGYLLGCGGTYDYAQQLYVRKYDFATLTSTSLSSLSNTNRGAASIQSATHGHYTGDSGTTIGRIAFATDTQDTASCALTTDQCYGGGVSHNPTSTQLRGASIPTGVGTCTPLPTLYIGAAAATCRAYCHMHVRGTKIGLVLVEGEATLDGIGTLTMDGTVVSDVYHFAEVLLDGTGSSLTAAVRVRTGACFMDSVGIVTAKATPYPYTELRGLALVAGSGIMVCAPNREFHVWHSLVGGGSMFPASSLTMVVRPTLAGAGSLSAHGLAYLAANAFREYPTTAVRPATQATRSKLTQTSVETRTP